MIAFDSSALIFFLERRATYAQLLLPLLNEAGPGVLISAVSLAEALVVPARDKNPVELDRVRAKIMEIPGLIVVPLDDEGAVRTAVIRARTGLKFPDSAIIAAAHIGDAHALIGNDRVWKNRDLGVPYHHLDDILAIE